MILSAISKQFTLADDGQIFFQPDSTNPLKGDVLARVVKGEGLLTPDVALDDGRDLKGEDKDAVREYVATWLKAHIYTVLEPLFGLPVDESVAEPVRAIALRLFAGVGIVPRGDVEEPISQLDPEMRKVLRDKKVRLGPLLIFMPDLNKPAAVHLRALLWSLYNDAPLPAPIPHDGAMSVVVDGEKANHDFYRAIGYPLYGPRAIRIDMLDRVINAVYDGAERGKFQAKHNMAEWMGCPIADLYGILEAMGHKRIEAPVEEQVAAEETKSEDVVPVEVAVAPVPEKVEAPANAPAQADLFAALAPEPVAVPVVVAEEVKVEAPKAEQKKPELDFFFLRRGKAHSEDTQHRQRPLYKHHHKHDNNKPEHKVSQEHGKGHGKKHDNSGYERNAEGDHSESRKFKKKKFEDGKKRDKKAFRDEPRVFSANAADHDNPFSVLQNLKLK